MPIFRGMHPKMPPDPVGVVRDMIQHGPHVPLLIGVHPMRAQELTKANKPIPAPISGVGLVDTGASISGIDESVINALAIPPITTANVGGVAGRHQHFIYPVQFSFPTLNNVSTFAPAVGVNFAGQTKPGGPPLIGLIGRDLLVNGILIYDGQTGVFTLCLG